MHTATLNKLLRNIKSDDASERRSAAVYLAEGDDRAIYPLIKALKDDNLGVQDAAMHSLMEMKRESTVYMVLPLLRENALLRNTALIILKEMGKLAVPLLYGVLNDRDDDVRKFGLDLIHDIEFCTYPEKLVEILTGDDNANVRGAAAKTLGKLQYKNAVPQLLKALNDEEWVCFAALEALTQINGADVEEDIIALLGNASETIRFAALEALGKLASARAVASLEEHIGRTAGFEREVTIRSIAMTGSLPALPGVTETLMSMFQEGEWEDRLIAIKGLVSLHHEPATPLLIAAAGTLDPSDPEGEEQTHVIRNALLSLGSIPALTAALDDTSLRYRSKVVAIEVLGDMKCRDAVASLIRVLKSDYRDIRRSSINSLGNIESDEARECLIEAIADHDSHVRKSAVMSLGKINETSAFDPLMSMINKEQYLDVIDAFISSLIQIDADKFAAGIGKLRADIQDAARAQLQRAGSGAPC
jgi:HEAT repeat protein